MTRRAVSLTALLAIPAAIYGWTGTASAQAPTARKYYVDGQQIPTPKQLPPVYPEKELRRRIGGTAVVAFTYAADGKVTSATIKTSSGNKNLDAAAVTAVRQWTGQGVAKDRVPAAGASETAVSFSP